MRDQGRYRPSMLGQGVYHLSEVAVLTDTPTATIRSWFKQRPDGRGSGPIFKSDFRSVGGDYAVSFLNLVDAYMAAFFSEQGVNPRIIRRAHTILRRELKTPHPFAHEDLCTDGVRIILDQQQTDVISKQMLFAPFKSRLTRLSYSGTTKLADTWEIANGVVIKPRINFGKPIVEQSSVSTNIVARQYVANKGNAALVARLFRITDSGVLNAYRFEEKLKQRRAA
ncbi:MAG: hypothetical protein H7Z14_06520 [Anaerolineae bacterium]|nr:hypothetical protein [Phycisphaerae bacterium]